MTLNANEPADQRLVSELASYIREARAAINNISGSGNVGVSTVAVAAGAISLSIGTELSSDSIEVVIMSGVGAATLATILGGTQGQIKLIIFQDSNVDLADGNDKSGGKFYLNHLPAASNFGPQQDDVIALVNVAGDAGATTNGYWKELFRTLSVK